MQFRFIGWLAFRTPLLGRYLNFISESDAWEFKSLRSSLIDHRP